MGKFLSKFVGIILVLTALVGWVGTALGLTMLWKNIPTVVEASKKGVQTLDQTFDSTEQFLVIVDSTLENVDTNITNIETAGKNIGRSIETSSTVINDLGKLSGEDFPKMISDVQASLGSMEKSAKLIDDTLAIIALIPLIQIKYNPDEPLNVSINKVAQNLGVLPETLERMGTNLDDTAGYMVDLKKDVDTLIKSIGLIKTNIKDARIVISQYQKSLTDLRSTLQDLLKNLPGWLNALATGLTIFLGWICLVLVGTFTQGLDMLRVK